MGTVTRMIVGAGLAIVVLLAVLAGAAEAIRPDGCGLDGNLPAFQDGGDILIKVLPGTYYVGNVNVIAPGVLRFTDPPSKTLRRTSGPRTSWWRTAGP